MSISNGRSAKSHLHWLAIEYFNLFSYFYAIIFTFIKVIDSCGAGLFGVFAAFQQLIDPGKFDQCIRVNELYKTNGTDISKYCLLETTVQLNLPGNLTDFKVPSVLGVCVPAICTPADLQNFTYFEVS